MRCPTEYVLDDRSMSPAGRKPLSRSSLHSFPTMQEQPALIVRLWPACRLATAVFRQNRSGAYAAGTTSARLSSALTVNRLPASAFSGRPPSAGGLNRASRHVPVHVGGSAGSITALACVSLYDTSVR